MWFASVWCVVCGVWFALQALANQVCPVCRTVCLANLASFSTVEKVKVFDFIDKWLALQAKCLILLTNCHEVASGLKLLKWFTIGLADCVIP